MKMHQLEKLDKIKCQSQGWLFRYVNRKGYDVENFTRQFLKSDFCRREWDADYSWFQFADATMTMNRLQRECTFKKGQTYFEDAIYWVGYMYRFLHLAYRIPSKKLHKKIPFKEMLVSFVGYHILDEKEAARRLYRDFLAKKRRK